MTVTIIEIIIIIKISIDKFVEHYKLVPNVPSTAINDLLIKLYNNLNCKNHLIVLFFDLTRAFVTVDHDLLLELIYLVGVRGIA